MSALDRALQQIWVHGVKIKELWKNVSPASTFGEQTIPISDIAKYQLCLIIHGVTNSIDNTGASIVALDTAENFTAQLVYGAYVGTNTVTATRRGSNAARGVKKVATGLAFEVGILTKGDGGISTELNNNTCIPHVIYGIQLLGGVIQKIKTFLASLSRREVHSCL